MPAALTTNDSIDMMMHAQSMMNEAAASRPSMMPIVLVFMPNTFMNGRRITE